jgi:excinuclease ABC subunit A
VLYRQLETRLKGGHSAKQHLGEAVGSVKDVIGWQRLADVALIDQQPIGRTPRSNPVTYVKAFDGLRALFAATPLARSRRYTPSTFSFNVPGGRCETCEGAGAVLVEMVFLANVFVPCDACGGTRFKREVLDVKLEDGRYSIHDVLNWTVDQAMGALRRQPHIARPLWYLQQVGLGYLRLGQAATTLSGGEAQRLKIARELALASGTRSKRRGRKLYILDEPTTGLHLDDVRTLCRVLDRLVDAGHTVLVIEHQLDLIKRADWVIDLGPGAGSDGGRIIAEGTPEEVASNPDSVTGRFLRDVL